MNFSLAMAERGGDYETVRQRRVPTESSTRANAIRRDEFPLVPGRAEAGSFKENQIAATISTQLMRNARYR